jgi:pheromone shutdown protein TraB
MTGAELDSRWRRTVPPLHRLLVYAVVPLFAAGMLVFGTRRILGRYLAVDDLPTREQELARDSFERMEKVIVDDRDALLADALTGLHQQHAAESIKVAVVYGAGHMPAIAAMLVARLNYHARTAECLTVFDYS